MTRRRVYLAVDLIHLRALVASGRFDPAGVPVFAVTSAVRLAEPTQDEQEGEYDAFVLASRAGAACVASTVMGAAGSRNSGLGRVVVVSADLPTPAVRDAIATGVLARYPGNEVAEGSPGRLRHDLTGYEVAVGGFVNLADVVAIHLADPASDPDEELAWYDVSELSDVLTQLGG
ncbi:MAG TPA: hypothetical protein VES01_07670 [Dermatophilaceae bacterium]|nr:hypothetical protein [Dermatophilaceae bacterium]